jgi:hypothetical protein
MRTGHEPPIAWPGDRVLARLHNGLLAPATVRSVETHYSGRDPYHVYQVRPDDWRRNQWLGEGAITPSPLTPKETPHADA